MISRYSLLFIILTGIVLNVPVSGTSETEFKIIGRLVKTDVEGGIIYIMHDSRTVRFRASKEICSRFSMNSKPLVAISYSKCGGKGFCINTIEIIPDENNKEVSAGLKSDRVINTNRLYK